ncbi:D-glycero-beta-D-manno-heptose 1,7-bisphosphate 7-phosphatase [Desulfobacca acetoxidans]|uniref:D,D-heptose 1,7-bisphosphate phosphatase n=1 Tax=Desulfobacca acetoxidans (strain ATCC 700848 / DSM 11109 / ASRB2) TaxID=880072 RepID=F2NC24_DESAR|nr:D-glycero-beta-D-manno-heptose 1,7-bisphosphate 7-phosphatase [Desulfobacca acetoxidans]AEB08819.1 histidinol-phosphate phosphatase family protein [Desulfobacca acetoxidans DSM 11109]
MQRAVFLDRDGVINEEMGYINHLSRFRLLPGSAAAISRLNQQGLKVVVATNQSGVARKYFPASLIDQVHDLMIELLRQQGAAVDAIYVCQHAPDEGCPCRKPRPGLLLQAAQELGIDLGRSYVVGDRYNDIQLAANVGAQGILVLTGYGRGELENYQGERRAEPDYIAADLTEAVEWILRDAARHG